MSKYDDCHRVDNRYTTARGDSSMLANIRIRK